MAEDKSSLRIDSDWKKQAQEEKKRLAEQEEQARKAVAGAGPATGPVGVVGGTGAAVAGAGGAPERAGAGGQRRETPPASIETLVQSLVTQTLFYLGELNTRAGQSVMDLDMAKHHVDTLAMLEEKTKSNLTPEEQHMLDAALYETRMRYISVASRYAQLP